MAEITTSEPPDGVKKRERRKEARPTEIIEAAMALFGEQGFGATKMEEVARRAGIAKGTLFFYFPTKHDLFRAVAQTALALNLQGLRHAATDLDRPFRELVPQLLNLAAGVGASGLPKMVRLLLAESRTFPDLAQVWYDEVVSKVFQLLIAAVERAQSRGEIRAGDARLFAFSILGPMLSATFFREVFGRSSPELPDLPALAKQHANVVLEGLLL